MNKKILILGILLAIAAVGYFFYTSYYLPKQISIKEAKLKELIEGLVIESDEFRYYPSTIKVKPGEKFTYINREKMDHSITSDKRGIFDTGLIHQDGSIIVTAPSEPGTYPFHCSVHPAMVGTLIVE